jgi:hypothetical protein
MDMSGRVSAGSPMHVRLTGKGHQGTSTADFHYEYDGFVLPQWENGVDQRLVIGGTVLRAKDHGSGASLARESRRVFSRCGGMLDVTGAADGVAAEMVDAVGTHESAEVGIRGFVEDARLSRWSHGIRFFWVL